MTAQILLNPRTSPKRRSESREFDALTHLASFVAQPQKLWALLGSLGLRVS
jgi:hypothetical protein